MENLYLSKPSLKTAGEGIHTVAYSEGVQGGQ